ncbi:MAG: HAD-IA family hydrolase [Betaproteobacteria bacterium]|nr:HAD-IA family hydrolase [Gammaproteobacteria bacterium]MDH3436011.1 HAD-IA family hydrolase [Betaproteobacteria bacterium]
MIKAVLFDLDGTLADTAPDLAHALNTLRASRGMPPLPLAATRPVTSNGARGLLGVGFGIAPGHPDYDALRDEFLALYAGDLCRATTLFLGMPELLSGLEARRLPWGVVTNKLERYTLPLLERLDLSARTACVIGGDTTPRSKPHPEPLLEASRLIGVGPQACVYVGDDRRDVEAGRAAGMKVAVAGWGYLNGNDSDTWGGDWILNEPQQLLRLI